MIQGTESHVKLSKPLFLIGKAVDLDTGEPVLIKEVSLCQLQKQPDGSVVRTGCGIAGFEQDDPGHFRIPYAILPEKSFAGYHITLWCQGYDEGHLNVTPLNDAKDVADLLIQVKRSGQAAPADSSQGLKGTVLLQDKPVAHGWITLNKHHGQRNAPNAVMMHGRTTECGLMPFHHAEIKQGTFRCEALEPGEYAVMLYVPGQAPTYISQVTLTKGTWTNQDFVISPGCSIAGKVPTIPALLKNELWVIAFSRQGYRTAVRMQQDGSFTLSELPAGEYGLKVGCEAIRDKETDVEHPGLLPQGKQLSKAEYEAKLKAYEAPADPWKRATVVQVKAGQTVRDVILNMPEELALVGK